MRNWKPKNEGKRLSVQGEKLKRKNTWGNMARSFLIHLDVLKAVMQLLRSMSSFAYIMAQRVNGILPM